jgi:hypothetical protein
MIRGMTGKTAKTLFAPKSISADTNGPVIDLSAFKGQAVIMIATGACTSDSLGDASLVAKFKTGDSAAGGDATDTIATFATRDSATAIEGIALDLTAATGRYGRIALDIGSHTTAVPVAVYGLFDARGY